VPVIVTVPETVEPFVGLVTVKDDFPVAA
jgi:hypothetical protein